jgi:hypothetical protein
MLEEPDLSSILVGENPGPEAQAHFGASLAIGDVDGDNIGELIVGVPEGDGVSSEPDQGEVYVFRALEALIPAVPITIPQLLSVPPASVVQIRPVIERAFARYGTEIATGDINGDQIDDIVASAPFIDVSQIAEQEFGTVYVYLGPFFPGQPFRNEDQLLQDNAIASYERFGAALALGNLDGDQDKEIIIGVPGQSVSGIPSGGKLVAYNFSPAGSTEVLTLPNPAPVPAAGFGLSLAAGDLNGDGRDDVVTATDESVSGHPNAGLLHVSLLGPNFTTTYDSFSSETPIDFERFGDTLLVTDLNADGLADVAAGAPGSPMSTNPFAGQVFVYFSTLSPSLNDTFHLLALDSDLPQPYGLFGTALAAGDFAAAGVNDLAAGEPLALSQGILASGKVLIFTDLLHRKDNLTISQLFSGVPPMP